MAAANKCDSISPSGQILTQKSEELHARPTGQSIAEAMDSPEPCHIINENYDGRCNASKQAMNKNPKTDHLKATQWQPGASANPGGAPSGKRLSTWMVELAALDIFPDPSTLPIMGQIALARLKDAIAKHGERSTEIIADLTEKKQITPTFVFSGSMDAEIKEASQEWNSDATHPHA